MKYKDLSSLGSLEISRMLSSDNPVERGSGIIAASLSAQFEEAQEICLSNAGSSEPTVRGNSVLGLGHIARIHRNLDMNRAMPVLRKALLDPDSYVRGQANSAVDDIKHFLNWKF